MKRFYALLLPALFLASASFAQSNFKPGYVVTAVGDTLKGNVDHQEWVRNPKEFKFKDQNEKLTIYSAANAKAFGIDGFDHYLLATLPVSMDQIEIGKLHYKYDPSVKTVTVFLRAVTKGQFLSLYSLTDDLKARYIIIDNKTGDIRELSHHFYLDQTKRTAIEINRYRIELTTYADTYQKNTASLSSAIQRANYSVSNLSEIVNTINGDDVEKRSATATKGSFRFFLGAALNSSKLTYRYDTELAVDPKDHSDLYPQINLGFDYFVDPNTGRVLLRGEVNAYFVTMKATSANATKEISSFTVNLHPQVIYNFYNTAPLKIFAGTGLLVHFSNYTKSSFVITNGRSFGNENDAPDNTVWLALPVKVGVVLNKTIELYGAYHFATTIDNYQQASGRVSTVQFGFNYLFSSKK